MSASVELCRRKHTLELVFAEVVLVHVEFEIVRTERGDNGLVFGVMVCSKIRVFEGFVDGHPLLWIEGLSGISA